jgi:Family of unknown function (DUF6497)
MKAGRANLIAALVAVAVGIGWVVWVKLEPPAAPPAAPALAGAAIPVPSGQRVTFLDRSEEAGGTLRFRFLAPDLGTGNLADEASGDMEALCNSYALGHLPEGPAPRHIIVSLASEVVPLGETRPDVTQVFDAYHTEAGKCVWEMF